MKETTIRISADGKEALCLFEDNNPFEAVASTKQIARASNVKFDNDLGLWFVHDSEGRERISQIGFQKRKDAIDHEISLLVVFLAKSTDKIYNLFK